ncbi:MAG TPA: hypothetical protein VGF76_21640 [Polyangiaceae bacterium]
MAGAVFVGRLARIVPGICRSFAYFSAFALAGSLLWHLLHNSTSMIGLFEDDFYYYVVIADHLMTLGKLSFDGLTLTNGFHPLWLVVVLLLRVLTGGFGKAFFFGLALVFGALAIASYESLRVLAERLGVSRALAAVLALLQISEVIWLISTGMEVALAIPLFAWLLAEVARAAPLTPARAGKIGALASLSVLARLDFALALVMLVGLWLAWVRPWPRRPIPTALAFAAGCLPMVGYFASNLAFFGALLPTSGRAKQLGNGLHSTARFIQHCLDVVSVPRLLTLALGGIALLLLRRKGALHSSARVAALTALAFPVIFAVINAVRSDWFVFVWYRYPIIAGLLCATALVGVWVEGHLKHQNLARAVALALAIAAMLVPLKGVRYFMRRGMAWSDGDNTLLPMARRVAEGLRHREGRIAMGDKAGISTFILNRPVVQLEGLVADNALLNHIKHQDSLNAVLADYGVDYLVVSAAETRPQRHDGCYDVVAPNPNQAGSSPAMTGRFCSEPLMHFETPESPHSWWHSLALETFVFDVRKERTLSASRETFGD